MIGTAIAAIVEREQDGRAGVGLRDRGEIGAEPFAEGFRRDDRERRDEEQPEKDERQARSARSGGRRDRARRRRGLFRARRQTWPSLARA